jgi:hypothetical protein
MPNLLDNVKNERRRDSHLATFHKDQEAGYQDRLNRLPPSVGISDAYYRGYCERICDEIARDIRAGIVA